MIEKNVFLKKNRKKNQEKKPTLLQVYMGLDLLNLYLLFHLIY